MVWIILTFKSPPGEQRYAQSPVYEVRVHQLLRSLHLHLTCLTFLMPTTQSCKALRVSGHSQTLRQVWGGLRVTSQEQKGIWTLQNEVDLFWSGFQYLLGTVLLV